MAGWVRVETRFISHPKVLDIGPLGEALWLRGLCYAGEQLTDGFVPSTFLKRMSDMKAFTVAAKLVAAGLWAESDGGYVIHDYLEWQRSRDEANEISSKRAEAGRRGGKQKASNLLANAKQNPSNLSSKTLADKNTDTDTDTDTDTEVEQKNTSPPLASKTKKFDLRGFDEFYALYPKHQKRADAETAWAKLKPEARKLAIDAIRCQIAWPSMTGDPQFIPLPASWLGGRRWEDEPPQIPANGRASPSGRMSSAAMMDEAMMLIESEQMGSVNLIDVPYRIGAD